MSEGARYRLYGITLETSWALKTPLREANGEPDLRFSVSSTEPGPGVWAPEPGFTDPGDDGSEPAVGRIGGHTVVRFPMVGDAWFVTDHEIVFHLTHPEYDFYVEMILLGILLAYWLEQRGFTALHASAAARGGWAIGIMGPNGAGKTSLSLDLVDRGFHLMTDDLLAVSGQSEAPTAHPGFPQVRLWPDEAVERFGSIAGLEKAHPLYEKLRIPLTAQPFPTEPAKLMGLYVRTPTQTSNIDITPVTGPDALFNLMFNSFALGLLDVPQARERWIKRLGALLGQVPLFTVSPSDDRPATADLVAEHASSLAAQSNLSG
ncbi:MAG: hypothetical protein WED83_00720 [Acidimicrobiia bacterium]